jgi:phosphate acetyltransferase
VTLLGSEEQIRATAHKHHLSLPDVIIIDPKKSDLRELYAKTLLELRKHKGMTAKLAAELVVDPTYFGTLMVHCEHADGMVSGATHTTADTLRPALQIIKTKEGVNKASSFFIMVPPDSSDIFFFTDCAFVPHPTAEDLAESAKLTADAAKGLGIVPKIAMLSFSTKGSAHDPALERILQATHIVRQDRPDLLIDGELQLDAAIVPEVAARKCPQSPLKGEANVLVFPSLDAGNIGYKLVERFGHAKPIGPVIVGLKKPVNDVSRGADVDQIVLTACLTAIQGDFS